MLEWPTECPAPVRRLYNHEHAQRRPDNVADALVASAVCTLCIPTVWIRTLAQVGALNALLTRHTPKGVMPESRRERLIVLRLIQRRTALSDRSMQARLFADESDRATFALTAGPMAVMLSAAAG